MAAWVDAESTHTQTPPELAAGMALASLAAVTQGAAVIECRPGWTEELVLRFVIQLPSGERKSKVVADASRPVRAIERERSEDAKHDVAKALATHAMLEQKQRDLERKVAREQADPEDLALAAEALADAPQLFSPRILIDDITPEALAGRLAEHGRIASLSAETPLLSNLAGNYSDGRPNLHLACQSYDGESTSIDRRGRAAELIDRPLFSFGIAAQPDVLAGYVRNGQMRAQGFLARCAFLAPASLVGRRNTLPPPVPHHVTDAYDRLIRSAAERAEMLTKLTKPPRDRGFVGFVGTETTSPGVLRFDAAAQARFDSLCASHEPRLDPNTGDLAPIADWANKHPGRVARIAGQLHLAEHDASDRVDLATLVAAERIGECLIAHALFVLHGEDTFAPWRRWLNNRGNPTVTLHEIHRRLGRSATADDARALAQQLSDAGYLKPVESKPGPSGGRPSEANGVHPELLGDPAAKDLVAGWAT
jgi:hypothetical protein